MFAQCHNKNCHSRGKYTVFYNGHDDVGRCSSCNSIQPTGHEEGNRRQLEASRNHILYPKVTVARAIHYASSIYAFATHNTRIDTLKIEDSIASSHAMETGFERTSLKLITDRSFGGSTDSRTGLMVYVVSGQRNGKQWDMVYVVFRGSRGDAPGGGKNPEGAGWDSASKSKQMDWAANFTNAQVIPPWNNGVKVHAGFLELYVSRQDMLFGILEKVIGSTPNAQVVCTGHSLGAALATLCAHDISCRRPRWRPMNFVFCAPKVGNLQFAEDFEGRVAGQMTELECEANRGPYYRGVTFIQGDDMVSKGGRNAFKRQNAARIQQIANKVKGLGPLSGGLIQKAYYNSRKTPDKLSIYYLAPNVYRVRRFLGLHSPAKMLSDLS